VAAERPPRRSSWCRFPTLMTTSTTQLMLAAGAANLETADRRPTTHLSINQSKQSKSGRRKCLKTEQRHLTGCNNYKNRVTKMLRHKSSVIKLEIWGRTQRETTRHHKSYWGNVKCPSLLNLSADHAEIWPQFLPGKGRPST